MKFNYNSQHNQAGRENLVTKLSDDLGTTEKKEFEFTLMKPPPNV